jgi:segregation and condensation protein B
VKREIEALLFATDAPLSVTRLRGIFSDAAVADIKSAIDELNGEYELNGNSFSIVEFGGGWQIASRPAFAPLIEKLFRGRRYARLSRAGLEVLAIVAYRQPITRLEIDDIRGVQSSGALSTLLERGLATVMGRSEAIGHPLLYGTTREFLNHLGLKGLGQLPQLPDLATMVDDRDSLKAFASQFGEEITDEEIDDWQREPEVELIDEPDDEAEDATDDTPDDIPDDTPDETPDGLPGDPPDDPMDQATEHRS